MNRNDRPPSDELAELIEALHDTYRRIASLVGDSVDAVVHPSSGTTYLLPQVQHALRLLESAERRHAAERAGILDALPATIALLDQTGRIVAVNGSWRRFAAENALGDTEYAVGRNYLEICEAARGPDAGHAKEVALGIRRILSRDISRFSLEYPCHSPEAQRWFMVTAAPLGVDKPAGAVVMHIDVSDRRRAEARADELRRRLERLIDQANVGILVHHNFVPVLANAELARMFAFENPEEVLTLGDCRKLFAEDEFERLAAYNAARLAGAESPAFYQVVGKRRDGSQLVVDIRTFTIEWDDEMAVCMMLTDITVRLATEEQLRKSQRLEAVGQLTGGIAHDFNNLLTVILGNAELLVESLSEDRRLRRLAEMTAKAAGRGAELTNRLLAFARLQPLDPRAVDVNQQMADMDGLLRRILGEHVEIELIRGDRLWPAMVDPGQLENAVLNLCINARDAMPDGGRLTIETMNVKLDAEYATRQAEVDPGQYVMIAVSDNGNGMDSATLDRAFEPFFTTKGVGKGSGLGLSMVYGFAKQSRGHVRIYSEPGEGTTVKLYLPCAATGETAARTAVGEATPEQGNERILLVEDDDLVRDHVTGQLIGLGYTVVAVSSGREAMAVLDRGEPFDLLFTDIVMPGGMNGRQLADAAKTLRPGLPVLFTSGYTENAIVHHGRLDRGAYLLTKPYRRHELAEKIRFVLAQEVK